jgi:quercetin dioxygenase-like cupin family protein
MRKPKTEVVRPGRRAALTHGAWAALAAALGVSPTTPAAERRANRDGWTRLRRVVTSVAANGRGAVLFDGEPSNVLVMNGTRIARLWEVPAVPANPRIAADLGATAGNAYREGFRGASYYVAELPGGKRATPIPLHSTPSLDFMAILSGKVALTLEDGEVILRHGDTLVQGGNLHGWHNRWREPCLLLFVVLSAAAQPARRAVELTFLKSWPGERERLRQFIERNWFAMDRIAQSRGLMTAYSVVETGSDEGPWNVVVSVTYPNERGYDGIASDFEEIRRAHVTVLIDGKGLRELGSIVETRRTYERAPAPGS